MHDACLGQVDTRKGARQSLRMVEAVLGSFVQTVA